MHSFRQIAAVNDSISTSGCWVIGASRWNESGQTAVCNSVLVIAPIDNRYNPHVYAYLFFINSIEERLVKIIMSSILILISLN